MIRPLELNAPDLVHALQDRLVLSFFFDVDRRSFTLVCEHWEKCAPPNRGFVRLVFSGVVAFNRELGVREDMRRFGNAYVVGQVSGGVVVQACDIRQGRKVSTASVWFGSALGGVGFAYSDVTAFERTGAARQLEGVWRYFDSDNGEEFAFEHPFGAEHSSLDDQQ